MSMMAVTVPGRCHGRADRSWRAGWLAPGSWWCRRGVQGAGQANAARSRRKPSAIWAAHRQTASTASSQALFSSKPRQGKFRRPAALAWRTRSSMRARTGPLPRGGPRFPVAQHLNPGHRIRPVGDRHCQVGKHLPRQMQREPAVGVQQRPGHRLGRPRSRRQFPQQRGPGVRHHATPVRADLDPRPAAATQGTFPHLRPVSAYQAAQPPADS